MSKKVWRYTTEEKLRYRIPAFAGILAEPFVHEWFTICPDGFLTINEEYSSDGCSWVPDGPRLMNVPECFKVRCNRKGDYIRQTTPGAIPHDLGYQFLDVIAAALGLDPALVRLAFDLLFAEQLKQYGFRLWKLYKFGVRTFGAAHRKVTRTWRRICGLFAKKPVED